MVAPFGGTRGGSGRFPYERRRRAAPPFRPALAMSRRASARSLGLFRSFVSPFAVRVWFTVAAAIRSAVPSVRPRSLRFSLMCSYWRSRLSVQASCGMARTSLALRLQGACALGAEPLGWQGFELGDVVHHDVRRNAVRRVVGVVPLTDVDRGHPPVEAGLRRREERRLVVDVRVMPLRKARRDVVEVRLLVVVDEVVPARRLSEPRALDLQWLVHRVSVGQDDDRTDRPQARDDLERPGKEELRERRLIDEPFRLADQPVVARLLT